MLKEIQDMKVVLLLGSIRSGRQSHTIIDELTDLLRQKHISVELIDLAAYTLPLMEERVAFLKDPPGTVIEVGTKLQAADAIIFITPEYHGSYSGVLKNAIDYFWNEFHKKAIGVVTVSAGKYGGINASTLLQQLILSLGAFPLPAKLLVSEVYKLSDPKEVTARASFVEAANKFLDEFIWFAEAINLKRKESSWA